METLEQTLKQTHDWALERIEIVSTTNMEDAYSITEEFYEWLDPNNKDHDVFSMTYIGEGSEYE